MQTGPMTLYHFFVQRNFLINIHKRFLSHFVNETYLFLIVLMEMVIHSSIHSSNGNWRALLYKVVFSELSSVSLRVFFSLLAIKIESDLAKKVFFSCLENSVCVCGPFVLLKIRERVCVRPCLLLFLRIFFYCWCDQFSDHKQVSCTDKFKRKERQLSIVNLKYMIFFVWFMTNRWAKDFMKCLSLDLESIFMLHIIKIKLSFTMAVREPAWFNIYKTFD